MPIAPFILNINKPTDLNSTKVVSKLKYQFQKKAGKVGHFGTLDPFATGVLLVGFSGAAKLNDYIHDFLPKTYRAHGFLGERTDTGDLTGEVVETSKVENLGTDLISSVAQKFVGDYWQSPPAYSAAKYKGKALHEYARKGIIIEKPPVLRKIHKIKILSFKHPLIEFEVTVGTGTYIRVLFEDLAKELGTVGHLKTLERSSIGPFCVDNALDIEKIEQLSLDTIKEQVFSFSLDAALPFPVLVLNESDTYDYRLGRPLERDCEQLLKNEKSLESKQGLFWVKSECDNSLLGLAKLQNRQVKVEFNLPNLNS